MTYSQKEAELCHSINKDIETMYRTEKLIIDTAKKYYNVIGKSFHRTADDFCIEPILEPEEGVSLVALNPDKLITVYWEEYTDGEFHYLSVDFPVRYLWENDWEEQALSLYNKEIEEQELIKKRMREEYDKQDKERKEIAERKQYEYLKKKYK